MSASGMPVLSLGDSTLTLATPNLTLNFEINSSSLEELQNVITASNVSYNVASNHAPALPPPLPSCVSAKHDTCHKLSESTDQTIAGNVVHSEALNLPSPVPSYTVQASNITAIDIATSTTNPILSNSTRNMTGSNISMLEQSSVESEHASHMEDKEGFVLRPRKEKHCLQDLDIELQEESEEKSPNRKIVKKEKTGQRRRGQKVCCAILFCH